MLISPSVLNRLKEEAPRYAEIVDTLTPEERERFRRPANAYSGPLVDIGMMFVAFWMPACADDVV